MKKEILNQLKSEYEKLEIKPSEDLWDKINQMDFSEDQATVETSKQPFKWWKFVAVIILLISVGGLFYFNSNEIKHNSPAKIATSKSSENQEINIISSITDPDSGFVENNKSRVPNSIQKIRDNGNDIKSTIEILKSNQTIVKNELSFTQENSQIINTEIKVADAQIPVAAEKEKVNYIKADELLLGREFDKTRKENLNEHGKFGVLDMGKIKGPRPSSFKILGMTVFSDSLDTK